MKQIVALLGLLVVLALVKAEVIEEEIEAVNPVCELCHTLVNAFQHSAPRKPTELVLDVIGTTYCTKKKLQHHNVCKGAVT